MNGAQLVTLKAGLQYDACVSMADARIEPNSIPMYTGQVHFTPHIAPNVLYCELAFTQPLSSYSHF